MTAAKKIDWEFAPNPMNGGNHILQSNDFRISFAGGGAEVTMFAPDSASGETALVRGRKFFILNGDWRKQYEKLVPEGFAACFALFEREFAEHGSSWSNKPDELPASDR